MAITTTVLAETSEYRDIEERDDTIGYLGYRREWKAGTAPAVETAINQAVSDALSALRTYVATPSPTSAQTVAVVKVICQVLIGLVRIRLGRLDATD